MKPIFEWLYLGMIEVDMYIDDWIEMADEVYTKDEDIKILDMIKRYKI